MQKKSAELKQAQKNQGLRVPLKKSKIKVYKQGDNGGGKEDGFE